jgi:signal transduction histidine kinase
LDWEGPRKEFREELHKDISSITSSAACLPLKNRKGWVFGTLLLRWEKTYLMEENRQVQIRLEELASEVGRLLWPLVRYRSLERGIDESGKAAGAFVGSAVFENILAAAKSISGLDEATLRVREGESELWTRVSDSSHREVPPRTGTHPVLRKALEELRPVWVTGLRSGDGKDAAEWREFIEKYRSSRWAGLVWSIDTIVCVPLVVGAAEVVGILTLYSEQRVEEPVECGRILSVLASHAALALSQRSLLDELERRVRLAEPLALVGGMLAGFLHFFGNSLASLAATVALMGHPRMTPERLREKVPILRESIERLRRLQRDLRLFATARKSEYVADTNLLDMARSLVPFFETTGGASHFIDLTGMDAGVSLRVNPSELSIAFQMIMQNAIEAMDKGGSLAITARRDSGRRKIEIAFRDEGCGMSEEMRLRCMQPFVSSKLDGGGTGLGLAIVFGITRRYGGSVEIESQLEAGTTVRLVFPSEDRT